MDKEHYWRISREPGIHYDGPSDLVGHLVCYDSNKKYEGIEALRAYRFLNGERYHGQEKPISSKNQRIANLEVAKKRDANKQRQIADNLQKILSQYDDFSSEPSNPRAAKEWHKKKAAFDRDYKRYKRTMESYPVYLSGEAMLREFQDVLASRDFVAISVDLEFYEQDPNIITEIGISVLEAEPSSKTFVPDIRTIHLIPEENQAYVNGDYFPDKKGLSVHAETSVLPLEQCKLAVGNIFEKYADKGSQGTPLYIVGHGVEEDLYRLLQNEFPICWEFVVLDTALIWQSITKERDTTSLGGVLAKLHVVHRFLHNAANDAYASLIALLLMCDTTARAKLGVTIVSEEEAAVALERQKIQEAAKPKDTRTPRQVRAHKAIRNANKRKNLFKDMPDVFSANKNAASAVSNSMFYPGRTKSFSVEYSIPPRQLG